MYFVTTCKKKIPIVIRTDFSFPAFCSKGPIDVPIDSCNKNSDRPSSSFTRTAAADVHGTYIVIDQHMTTSATPHVHAQAASLDNRKDNEKKSSWHRLALRKIKGSHVFPRLTDWLAMPLSVALFPLLQEVASGSSKNPNVHQ